MRPKTKSSIKRRSPVGKPRTRQDETWDKKIIFSQKRGEFGATALSFQVASAKCSSSFSPLSQRRGIRGPSVFAFQGAWNARKSRNRSRTCRKKGGQHQNNNNPLERADPITWRALRVNKSGTPCLTRHELVAV